MPLGLGGHWWIILLVLLIVLIVYGPGKLPDVGGAIGKGIREFRKASSDLQEEIKKGTSEPPSDAPKPPETRVSSEQPKPPDAKAS